MDTMTAQAEQETTRVPNRNIQRIIPKNGRFPVILLAGGPADRARELRDMFAARRGSLVKYHWNWEQRSNERARPLPRDVDLVVVLRTMCSHPLADAARGAAYLAGVPVVVTAHKWSVMDGALKQRVKLPSGELPVNVSSTAIMESEAEAQAPAQEPAPAAPPVAAPAPVAATAPLETAERHGPVRATEDDPEVRAARVEAAKKDTLSLIRELQSRLGSLGMLPLMIDASQVTFSAQVAAAGATH